MIDNYFLYFSIGGFLISFTIFIYFASLYSNYWLDDEDFGDNIIITPADKVSNMEANPPTLREPKAETENFKFKIQEIKCKISQKKRFQELQIKKIISDVNELVLKIEKLDAAEVQKMNPYLDNLADELERVRKNQIGKD